MTEWIKAGVMGTLSIPMRKCHGRLVRLYASKNLDFFTTSIQEGNHSPGSLHPDGNAEDFHQQGVPLNELKAVAGPGFDVVVESDHVHVEYDPK